MLEIILLGRGGQGGVTASEIFAESAVLSGTYPECSAFPSFGTERRGCPVAAFCRISDQKIWKRSYVKEADAIAALDIMLINQSKINQLKNKSFLVINTEKSPDEVYSAFNFGSRYITIATADLFKISRDIELLNKENQPIINTSILGILTGLIDGIEIKNLEEAIINRFGDNKKSLKNVLAAKTALEQAKVKEFLK